MFIKILRYLAGLVGIVVGAFDFGALFFGSQISSILRSAPGGLDLYTTLWLLAGFLGAFFLWARKPYPTTNELSWIIVVATLIALVGITNRPDLAHKDDLLLWIVMTWGFTSSYALMRFAWLPPKGAGKTAKT